MHKFTSVCLVLINFPLLCDVIEYYVSFKDEHSTVWIWESSVCPKIKDANFGMKNDGGFSTKICGLGCRLALYRLDAPLRGVWQFAVTSMAA